MKRIFIIIIIFLTGNLSFAQNENEKLEQLYNLVQRDRANEFYAQELVNNYYFDTKDKVRAKYDKLTSEEYKNLDRYQKMMWENITSSIKYSYSGKYLKYYQENKDVLEKYREKILDKLYEYIYNSDKKKDEKLVYYESKGKSSIKVTATQISKAESMFNNYLPKLLKSKGENASIYNQKAFTGDFTNDGIDDIIIWFVYGFGGTAIGGIEAAFYEVKNNEVKVVAGYSPEYRFSIDKIENGIVYTTKTLYAKNDSNCCPSLHSPVQLFYKDNKVIASEK